MKLKIIIITVVVLIIGSIGLGAAYWYFSNHNTNAPTHQRTALSLPNAPELHL